MIYILLILLSGLQSASDTETCRWWPVQKAPAGVVRVVLSQADSNPPSVIGNRPLHMLVESLAGLAAKAVSEGRDDEMAWLALGSVDYEDWFAHAAARLGVEMRGQFTPWELVDRMRQRGIIKGYILYRSDTSAGELYEHRPGIDNSVNVATSLCGLLDGVLVEESLEAEAKAHGLTLLLDARDKTQQWVFDMYRDRFNRHLVNTQDPKVANARDLAIAHGALTVYGFDEPVPAILHWMEPLSPVLGWNGGDEYESTLMLSLEGHFQTATNWCLNLPFLMAASEQAPVHRARSFDPSCIDWNDKRHAVSYIITDGDNVQWYMGGLCRAQGDSWYGHPQRGRFPFGWSCCFSQLAQLCPETLHYCVDTQTVNDTFIEWGGGYFYPDKFGLNRPDGEALLARHARRTWALMQQTGTRIIAFNVSDFDSEASLKAFETYARNMDGLLGILAFQYSPYEGGAGRVLWVKDSHDRVVPVVSARYSLWENASRRPRAGTPAKVAREIRDTLAAADAEGRQSLDWIITHAWSYFKNAPGTDEDAENMDQKDAPQQGGVRGYGPVGWCVDRLPDNVRVVLPEELLWRIRMQKDPAQTDAAMREITGK